MNNKKYTLNTLNFRVKFDRPITVKHYISPGGYEIKTADGEIYNFDFFSYAGMIEDKDNSILNVTVSQLDKASFPEAVNITPYIMRNCIFTDFFIYTGEDDEPEINPVKLLSMNVEFICDGKLPINIRFSKDRIEQISKLFIQK